MFVRKDQETDFGRSGRFLTNPQSDLREGFERDHRTQVLASALWPNEKDKLGVLCASTRGRQWHADVSCRHSEVLADRATGRERRSTGTARLRRAVAARECLVPVRNPEDLGSGVDVPGRRIPRRRHVRSRPAWAPGRRTGSPTLQRLTWGCHGRSLSRLEFDPSRRRRAEYAVTRRGCASLFQPRIVAGAGTMTSLQPRGLPRRSRLTPHDLHRDQRDPVGKTQGWAYKNHLLINSARAPGGIAS